MSLKKCCYFLFVSLLFCSCEFWNQPVRDYFEKWTNEIAIEKFEVTGGESYEDKDGNLCIASDQDATITLFMRNPYHYTLNSSDIGTVAGFPEITQDQEDTTLLRFTYSTDYLVARDGGQELGAEVTVTHPYRQEENSYTFSLKCNSRPPEIEEAAILYRIESNQNYYVLAFNCPETNLCNSNGIHRDIVSVKINGAGYSVQPDSSGNMVFADSTIFASGIHDTLHTLNREFTDSSRAVYFLSSDPVIEGVDKTFTISFVDSAGLENPVTLDTKVPSVAAPTVFDEDDVELSLATVNTLHTERGQVYGTVTVQAPTTDTTGQLLVNPDVPAAIKWELYSGNSTAGDRLIDGIQIYNYDGVANLKIPEEGEYLLVVWAEKSGYAPSARKEYHLNLEYETLKAPIVKNVTNSADETLSATANNYIELHNGAVSVQILLPTETTAGGTLVGTEPTTIYYTINSGKTPAPNRLYDHDNGNHTLDQSGFGQYCLTVYGAKQGYSASAPVSYLIKAHNDELYVAEDGNDTTGDGSSEHPYATLQFAVDELAAYNYSRQYTINVSGEVNGNQTVSNVLDGKATKLILNGTSGVLKGNGSGSVLMVQTSVPVEISSLGITGGNAPGNNGKGGGLYANAGSNITLNTGTMIYGNSAGYGGGGLYIESEATVTLAGATIGGSTQEKNSAISFGGGIYNDGTLNISSGTISYNSTTNDFSYGGGISNDGTLTISGGTISNNSVEGSGSKGAGVYNTGTFNMSGGTISSNTTGSNGRGAGVATEYSGNFVLSGGTISGNSGATDGNGILVSSSFTMSGNASIDDTNDVYVSNNKMINISGDLSEPNCAIITPENWTRGTTKILAGNVTDANIAKFSLTDSYWRLVIHKGYGVLDADFYVSNSGNDNSSGYNGTLSKPYKTIEKAASGCWSSQREFNIYIKDKLTGTQSIPANVSAQKINLQGYSSQQELDGNSAGSTLTINSSITIEITDLKITKGSADNGGGINIQSSSTVILGQNAEITGNTASAKGGGIYVIQGSNLCIYSNATIGILNGTANGKDITADNCGNKAIQGGGIYSEGKIYLGYDNVNSTNNCTGGIINNYASHGGGIKNEYGGEVYINSGNISGNRTVTDGLTGSGGGIYHGSGKLTMTGGTIEKNYAQYSGGGIIVRPSITSCALNGGTIQNNETGERGGAIMVEGTFSIGKEINIPYGGVAKKNDVFITNEHNNTPSIETTSNEFTYLINNYIHITGTSAIYNTTYQVLTGANNNMIYNTCQWLRVEDYNGQWIVDENGKMKRN